MNKPELQKKIEFISEIIYSYGSSLYEDYDILINNLLQNSDDVIYAFEALKIPKTIFQADSRDIPVEINVCFGYEVNLNTIFILTYILNEIFGDSFDVYIDYRINHKVFKKRIVVGSYIKRDEVVENISAPISPNEILNLDKKKLLWEKIDNLFPNNNYIHEDTIYDMPDDIKNERKFIILKLQNAHNKDGREFWVAKANPYNIQKMDSSYIANFIPYICNETRSFLFQSSMKKYLIYLMNKQKPITINEDMAYIGYLDGKEISVINRLGNDENLEDFLKLPLKCRECRLVSPNCNNCDYNSCCLECGYINRCNR